MPNVKIKRYIAIILNIAIVVMELISAINRFINAGISVLKFYTDESNILAMIACIITAAFEIKSLKSKNKQIPKWVINLKYISVCCLMVTFLVVIFVLAPSMGSGGYKYMLISGTFKYQHFLCPVIITISFLLFERDLKLNKNSKFIALIPTIIYAIVTVTLNIAKVMEGPYPFLLVYKQPIYMSIIWVIVIIGGAFLIALFVDKLHNIKLNKSEKSNLKIG